MLTTQIQEPIEVTIWDGCKGLEKIVSLPHTAKNLAVTVPPGIQNGQKIKIQVGPQTYLIPVTLTGDGIHTLYSNGTLTREVPVTPSQLQNGGMKQVPTPYGPVTMEIPPNTPENASWTFSGWGYPLQPNSSQRGDLLITATTNQPVATPTKKTARPIQFLLGLISSIYNLLIYLAISAAGLYTFLFIAGPFIGFLIEEDNRSAAKILKHNLTTWPPTSGSAIICAEDDLQTPEAQRVKRIVTNIGRQLDANHGYNMTETTTVAIVQNLPETHLEIAGLNAAGIASTDGCIQIKMADYHPDQLDQISRHEWSHIAAHTEARDAAHGPIWRDIARKFGSDDYQNYNHCQTGDHECIPRSSPSYLR